MLWVMLMSAIANSQSPIDTLQKQLTAATTDERKVELLGSISRIYMNQDLAQSDKYGQQMIEVAERSRNRKLMVKALLTNGERYSYLSGRKDNIDKAISYYMQGLELAKKNKLDEQMISAYLALSEVSRNIPDAEKALNFCNQAYSYIGLIKNDSLAARVSMEYGSVYLLKNEKILSLKNYMNAVRLSEDLKNDGLLRAGYNRLSTFYSMIDDQDKAIDYLVKAYEKLDHNKTGQTPYNKIQDLTRIGDLYAAKENYDMAMSYYNQGLRIADSLKYDPIKALVYKSIVNNYLFKTASKGIRLFQSASTIKGFFTNSELWLFR